jgi:RimJ/RimL family protein N-acetyltransferase
MYPYSLAGPAFDDWWSGLAEAPWRRWAVLRDGVVVGMSGAYRREPTSTEIGSTFYHPAHRGTGLNQVVKWLQLSWLFADGQTRVEFRVDARNARSQAAMLKLGARLEGVMRRDRITWTGHVRDTCLFSVIDSEWPQLEPRLRPAE